MSARYALPTVRTVPELRERIARTVAELAERYGNFRTHGGD